jgi:hypothetical protein
MRLGLAEIPNGSAIVQGRGVIYCEHWGAGMIKVLIMVLLVGVLPVMAAHFDEWSLKLSADKDLPR